MPHHFGNSNCGQLPAKACRVLRSCAADDPICCSGTLFCARSKLDFLQP